MIFLSITACSDSRFAISRVIDGNTVELANGIRVILANVEKNEGNIKILERYCRGEIVLLDETKEEIKAFSSGVVIAFVYNADGDCVNDLLSGITEITKDNIDNPQEENIIDSAKSVVHFAVKNGILEIPAHINGVEMSFIFDTGAALVSVSQTVADDLYEAGKLLDTDFIGRGQFSDANGDITEGTIINLRSVVIGTRKLNNVQACVTQGQNAPLLFGQSAFDKFGKVSIDYKKMEITFE